MPMLPIGNVGRPYKTKIEICNALGPRIPFTRACAIWPFMDFLDMIGAPTERFLQQANIPPALLEQPESLVPLHLVYSFFECAANAEAINDLGLLAAQQTSAYELGIFGASLREALTVHEYLHTGMQIIGSLTSGQQLWFTNEGKQIRMHLHMPGKEAPGFHHADLFTIGMTLRTLRNFTNNQWRPEEVCFHATGEFNANKADIFSGAKIIKEQAHSSFLIPKSLLQKAIPLQATWAQPRQKHLKNSQQAMPDSLENATKQLIASLLPDGCPDINLIAEAAGMSTRTFQRRLGEIGTSYSSLLQRTRMQLAAQRLAHTKMPVNEIAASLGYRDPANFTRAFRAKTAVSPRNYRAQMSPS